jgi:serine/threonine protein phosphatase 1
MWPLVKSSKTRKRPTVPERLRVYAIGDVHGRADLLDAVFSRIDADLKRNPAPRSVEILLGDYIDRGPASRQVLDSLIVRRRHRPMVFLKGNHETFVGDFLRDPAVLEGWRQFGALETLMSYGLKPKINASAKEMEELAHEFAVVLPNRHRQFLASLKTSFTCGDYLFAHAGVRPGIPLAEQREQDLLWIREDFLLCEDDYGKVIVHGHTPVLEPDFHPNRINIDTGAYATGRLTCLVIENDQVLVL